MRTRHRIYAIAAIKGGTAKTTTAAALAQAGAAEGRRVLAVDMDPQASLTTALAGDPNRAGTYSLLTGTDPAECIQKTPQGVYVIAGGLDLSAIHTRPGSGRRLQEALEAAAGGTDFTVIDTPPTAGELQNNALQAATDLIIPVEADPDSLQGLYQIIDIANHMQQINPALKLTGVVVTRYDSRPKLNKYYLQIITQKAQEVSLPILGVIRQGIAVKEARATRQNLYTYAPESKPAQDYRALYEKLKQGPKK